MAPASMSAGAVPGRRVAAGKLLWIEVGRMAAGPQSGATKSFLPVKRRLEYALAPVVGTDGRQAKPVRSYLVYSR